MSPMRHCLYGSSKPGNRSFGRFSRPLLEVYFTGCSSHEHKVKSLAVAEIFRYCKGFRLSYSYFCVLDQKYKRGVVHEFLSPEKCKLSGVTWTTSKIGDLGNFIKGAPLSKADISPDGTPFILYGELYTTYNEVITSIVRKTNAKVDEIYYSKIGDVIIPTSGETPEEISTASCVMQKDVILAGDLNIFRGNMLDGRILSYILNHIVNTEIARVAQGKSVVHVQASEISKIEISYPDADAQKKMISMFEAVAEKIICAEKQLEALSDLRRGLLQQLII